MHTERKRWHLAHTAVESRLAQPAGEVAGVKEQNGIHLYLGDAVTSQERLREYWKMPHLSKNDVAIERVAWLMVLGLLLTAIRLSGML